MDTQTKTTPFGYLDFFQLEDWDCVAVKGWCLEWVFIHCVYVGFYPSVLWLPSRTAGAMSGSTFLHLCLVLPFIFKGNVSQLYFLRWQQSLRKAAGRQKNMCAELLSVQYNCCSNTLWYMHVSVPWKEHKEVNRWLFLQPPSNWSTGVSSVDRPSVPVRAKLMSKLNEMPTWDFVLFLFFFNFKLDVWIKDILLVCKLSSTLNLIHTDIKMKDRADFFRGVTLTIWLSLPRVKLHSSFASGDESLVTKDFCSIWDMLWFYTLTLLQASSVIDQ